MLLELASIKLTLNFDLAVRLHESAASHQQTKMATHTSWVWNECILNTDEMFIHGGSQLGVWVNRWVALLIMAS